MQDRIDSSKLERTLNSTPRVPRGQFKRFIDADALDVREWQRLGALFCPAPWEQSVDLTDRVISDAIEDIGQIVLRIDAVHLSSLCRTPDYAELAPPSRRLPLVCVFIIRHSLTVDRLPTRTWEWPPSRRGPQRMPALQLVVHGAVVSDPVAGVLECVATTLANYAERVTAELAMCVPSEKLVRHSPAFGINRLMRRAA